ncbi:MAG: amylo-alpha-1,6-glucosidase, partial [Candidatus Xenobia bacterium]
DRDGDGFVEYQTRSSQGLRNQGWKDSWDAISFHDGKVADLPLALCEIQGYVYDAKLRTAELADEVWEAPDLARRLREQAGALKKSFNDRFWIERDGGFYAIALDGQKQQVDSVASNIGQLLWTGIVDESRIDAIVQHLMSDQMWSGWGVRTLSTTAARYNPIGYHTGAVWPHDNSLIAAGLVRCGRHQEAARIVEGMVSAAPYYDFSLPEAFAGFNRHAHSFPVRYPTSSSPQAWASGAPLLLLRAMLGLEPDRQTRSLQVTPVLPSQCKRIKLQGVPVFGRQVNVEVEGEQILVG